MQQYGTKWRSYKGGKNAWSRHRYVYDEIEVRIAEGNSEADVLAALQERLSALTRAPRQGVRGKKPVKANWQGLYAELAKARPRPKRPRANDDEDEDDDQEGEDDQVGGED